MPQSGDAINFTIINVKTSKGGNQHTNVKDVSIADNHTLDNLPITTPSNTYAYLFGMNKNETQEWIFL